MMDNDNVFEEGTIPTAEIPDFVHSKYEQLKLLDEKVQSAIQKAEAARQSAEAAAKEKAGLFGKKKAIKSLQQAAKDAADALGAQSEASMLLFEYQKDIAQISKSLGLVGLQSLAANRAAINSLKAILKGAAATELSESAQEELRIVVHQLKSREDWMQKTEYNEELGKEHGRRITKLELKQKILMGMILICLVLIGFVAIRVSRSSQVFTQSGYNQGTTPSSSFVEANQSNVIVGTVSAVLLVGALYYLLHIKRAKEKSGHAVTPDAKIIDDAPALGEALEEITIQNPVIIAAGESKEYKNQIIHFQSVIHCGGKLTFDHCVLLYGENKTPDEAVITGEAGSITITLVQSTIRCVSGHNDNHCAHYFIDAFGPLTVDECICYNCKKLCYTYDANVRHSAFINCGDVFSNANNCYISACVFDSCYNIFNGFVSIEECRFDKCSDIASLRFNSQVTACQFNNCQGNCVKNQNDRDDNIRLSECEFNNCSTEYRDAAGSWYESPLLSFEISSSGSCSTINRCVFNGIKSVDEFVIKATCGSYLGSDRLIAKVSNCTFSGCQTDRVPPEIIRKIDYYDGLIKNHKQTATLVLNCKGLADVGSDTYRASASPQIVTTRDGTPIGATAEVPDIVEAPDLS